MKKFKNVIFVIIGMIIGALGYVVADNVVSIINANQVGFSSNKTDKANVQEAIDELYDMANNLNFKFITIGNVKKQMFLSQTNDSLVGIVYFDPSNLDAHCDAINVNGNTTAMSGCMKWYVYEKADNENYGLLLDHNLSWGDYPSTTASLTTFKNSADSRINKNNIGLMKQNDVFKITGKSSWPGWYYFDTGTQTIAENRGTGSSKYYWLFDYTYDCLSNGCKVSDNNDEHFAYWAENYFLIGYFNMLGSGLVGTGSQEYAYGGLRPVITISK